MYEKMIKETPKDIVRKP